MKILLTGKTGQVGWELQRTLLPLGEVSAFGREHANLANPNSLRSLIHQEEPDVIVNAAAYTAVDQAEEERELAKKINAESPAILADEASKIGALLVHFSTDYVFDGSATMPYEEDDVPNPLSVYGKTKRDGEMAIQTTKSDHLILRTSWIFSSRGKNFLRTILKLSRERDSLSVVDDQIGSPTWARYIAEATAHCIRQSMLDKQHGTFKSGLFHLTSSGKTTWHGFANAIVEFDNTLKSDKTKYCKIQRISTKDYPTPAQRPLNSELSNQKIQTSFGLAIPSWQKSIQLCMEEMD